MPQWGTTQFPALTQKPVHKPEIVTQTRIGTFLINQDSITTFENGIEIEFRGNMAENMSSAGVHLIGRFCCASPTVVVNLSEGGNIR